MKRSDGFFIFKVMFFLSLNFIKIQYFQEPGATFCDVRSVFSDHVFKTFIVRLLCMRENVDPQEGVNN